MYRKLTVAFCCISESSRKLELHNFYSFLNIIRITKLRRMRWAVHVAHMDTRHDAGNPTPFVPTLAQDFESSEEKLRDAIRYDIVTRRLSSRRRHRDPSKGKMSPSSAYGAMLLNQRRASRRQHKRSNLSKTSVGTVYTVSVLFNAL
jgi:hypothetical protein